MCEIILTGDRPSGKLHLGHYVGTLVNRLALQKTKYNEFFIMIADVQYLTDNFNNIEPLKSNIYSLLADYLAVGLDYNKITFFLQSQIPQLFELFTYLLNYVSLERVKRNPTVKEELKQKKLNNNLNCGFIMYPISQAADIILFNTTLIPVGKDQLPMIEQTKEIIKKINSLYSMNLNIPKYLISKNEKTSLLTGIDGKCKMSKSLNNAIYLEDDRNEIEKKVMKAYTDPDHINIDSPGKVEGNVVFNYLDVFCSEIHFSKFLPEYKNLQELKRHYMRGGLGDVKIKRFLINIIDELLKPIREKKKYYIKDKKFLENILLNGNNKAKKIAIKNLNNIKNKLNLNVLDF